MKIRTQTGKIVVVGTNASIEIDEGMVVVYVPSGGALDGAYMQPIYASFELTKRLDDATARRLLDRIWEAMKRGVNYIEVDILLAGIEEHDLGVEDDA